MTSKSYNVLANISQILNWPIVSITEKARDIKDIAEKGVIAAKDKCKVQ